MSDLFARFRMTDVAAWPDPVKSMAWQMPWLSLNVETDAATDAIRLLDDCPEAASTDLFPKLAIKSWQESGRLRLISRDVPLASSVAARLATPTIQQKFVLQAWREASSPAKFHLFEWKDLQRVSEVRLSWSDGRISQTSYCHRNTTRFDESSLYQSASLVADCMPDLGSFVVQFVITDTGQHGIVDINPSMSSADNSMLDAYMTGFG